MTTQHRFAFLLTALLLATATTQAETAPKVQLGVKLLGANWQGDNGSAGSSFESSDGSQLGLNISYMMDKFYTGLNLQTGLYKFSSGSPDQFTATGRVAASTTTIRQNDFDLLLGYYFWPQISLFIDFKAVGNVWSSNDYEQNFSGLGFGASAHTPINQDWTLFGTIGFIANGKIKDNDKNDVGDGKSRVLELGGVYSLNEASHINMGMKFRNYKFEHINSTSQDYAVNALFIGFTHSFALD